MTKTKKAEAKATLKQLQAELLELSEVNPPLSPDLVAFLLHGIDKFLAKPNATLEAAFFPGQSGRPKGPASRSLERANKIEEEEASGTRPSKIAETLGVSARDPSRIKRRTAEARDAEAASRAVQKDAELS